MANRDGAPQESLEVNTINPTEKIDRRLSNSFLSNSYRWLLSSFAIALLFVSAHQTHAVATAATGAHGATATASEGEALKTCWRKQIQNDAEPCLQIREGLRDRFTKLVDSWKTALGPECDAFEIESVECRDQNRIDLLLAAG